MKIGDKFNTLNDLVAFLYHYHLNNHKIDSELEYQYCAPSRNQHVYEIYMTSVRNTSRFPKVGIVP